MRRALASLNKAIPGSWWDTDRETIGLNLKTSSQFILDTNQFHARLSDCNPHGNGATETCSLCLNPLTQAVALYRGPFLDGFYLPVAAEFERWAATERDRLERAFQHSLESLAVERAQAGDLTGAVEAWRRLAARDPFSTRVAVRLMQALAATGERVAALKHAHTHANLLREELGTEPAAELGVEIDRLRGQPAAAVARIPEAPVAVDFVAYVSPAPPIRLLSRRGRRVLVPVAAALLLLAAWTGWRLLMRGPAPEIGRTIAVLPFANISADEENEYFCDGLAEELLNALAKIDELKVAARTSAFSFKGKNAEAREIEDDVADGERGRVGVVLGL